MSLGFSQKQLEVLKFTHSDKDAIICDGSVRSGKSSVISIAYILWAMNNFKSKNFIIASQSVSAAERNIIKPLLDVNYLHDNFEMKYTLSNRCLILTRGKTTNYFYVFGGINEGSYQSVQGITAAGAFIDEVVLMPESFVNQVLARCSVNGSKFFFSCNPTSPTNWFYLNWVQRAEAKNAKYLHFNLDDNPSLSEEIKNRYKNMYVGVFYDRYILGKWVLAEGIIYRKFADETQKFIIDELPKDDELILINVGVDFGGTKSAHAFVATGFTKGLKKVIVLETERITEELSPEQLDKYYANFCKRIYDKYQKGFNTRCDNAEPVLIRGLKNAILKYGLRTSIKNALKKQIKSRIDLVIRLLGEERLFFLKGTTDHLQKALGEAVWNEKHEDERLDNGTTDIDILDAFEYSIEEYQNILIDEGGIKNEKFDKMVNDRHEQQETTLSF